MFQMTYQPAPLDSPVTTYWDLAQFNVAMQKGIVQSGRMVLNCYAQQSDIGIKPPLDSHSYDLTAAQVAAFQAYAGLAPGQLASFGYSLAQFIEDTVATPAVVTNGVITTPAVMASFFANATSV